MMSNLTNLLHGNSGFLKNLNLKYYLDGKCGIGFPDRHKAERIISESIYNTLGNDEVMMLLKQYEARCKEFIEVFDDDGIFRNLNAVAFA